MYNDIAYLVEKVDKGTVDAYGDTVFEESKTQVFVKVMSVKYSEFYTASVAGFNPQLIFEIADYYDYSGQPFVEYNDVLYKVIRTYRTGTSLQITCEHVDGD